MTEFKIGAGTSEDQLQQFFAYQFAQASAGLATTGVLSGLTVTQTATASADVLVNIGAAVTQSSLTAGADALLNNAQKTLDVLTANPMGATPRNDLVVFDPADATVKLVVGVPNAVPVDPTPPTGSVNLARLSHLASATTVPTARITDLRTITYPFGGPHPGASVARIGKRLHWGSYTVTTDASGYATITHGAGFTPSVVKVAGGNPSAQNNVLGSDTYTATSFRVRAVSGAGAPVSTSVVVCAMLGE